MPAIAVPAYSPAVPQVRGKLVFVRAFESLRMTMSPNSWSIPKDRQPLPQSRTVRRVTALRHREQTTAGQHEVMNSLDYESSIGP